MNNRHSGWSTMQEGVGLLFGVFGTRQELIRYECWNRGEVVDPKTDSLQPWMNATDKDVSRAWRRLRSRDGLRAVRVVVMPAEEAGND